MGLFQWLMKKITKAFGRSTNALFYTMLYREILSEINDITKDEEESLKILREIGKKASYESCERKSSVFKFMPGAPDKVLSYFEILWSVVFGVEMGEYSYEEIQREGAKYNDYILNIKNNPICAGYGDDEEDKFKFDKLSKESEGCSAGLCGMLETVANYVLKIKKNEYRIGIRETKCIVKGDENLQLYCRVYDHLEWNRLVEEEAKERASSKFRVEDILDEEIKQETKFDFIDKLQDFFTLDKLDDLLDQPLENIKERLAELIREKLNMEPSRFFDYFKNYEDDMIRIIGFLGIHLINEYGGFIEKGLKNELTSKIFGYLFKHTKEMMLLFLPLDVVRDYNQLLVNFLEDLAPPEMVENVRQFSGKDTISFLFEGSQVALQNLGINFEELKENVWEEIKREREDGLISADRTMVERTQEKFPKYIKIIQELLMILNEIFTLPVRIIVSESHYGFKTALNSVVSEEEGLYGSIRDRMDSIFDQIQEIRK
ncbi:MAG: hypothetical protein GF383_05170 [Candidatus Lokiarchaeota archaeon]|nr:hypothetical protein [Candidatus Lokiarchaeota archaeon]MBD3339283.1 hypothetical protein [Candidatus Lokiarchaeota archaeon]